MICLRFFWQPPLFLSFLCSLLVSLPSPSVCGLSGPMGCVMSVRWRPPFHPDRFDGIRHLKRVTMLFLLLRHLVHGWTFF